MIKLLEVSKDVTEVQVWNEDVFVGAGALSKPMSEVTEKDKLEAERRIIANWLCSGGDEDVGAD